MKNFITAFLLALCLISPSAFADNVIHNPKPYGLWLGEFKREALAQHISPATLDEAFAGSAPILRIIELDRKQPETTLTLAQYLENTVPPSRVQKGRELLRENRELLEKIERDYGVQPQFIVALWGIETSFGANTGGFNIIHALATLAYDGRRSEYFRGELIKSLQIIQQEHIAASELKGSWAGAMGQCQFMPTSFLRYAVDYDGDGKRDIWNSEPDVFASIAHYLQSEGWDASQGWGKSLSLPPRFDASLADIKQTKSLSEWADLGVRSSSGGALPPGERQVSLIMVGEGSDAVPYLVTTNYKVLLKWNRSRYFATAVGMLADRIGQ